MTQHAWHFNKLITDFRLIKRKLSKYVTNNSVISIDQVILQLESHS